MRAQRRQRLGQRVHLDRRALRLRASRITLSAKQRDRDDGGDLDTVAHGIHCANAGSATEVYRDWINALKDRAGRARVQVRVDRLIYFKTPERGGELIVLLAGSDKSTPQQDIKLAIAFATGL